LDILAEKRVVIALNRMSELRLDRALHRGLNAGRQAVAVVQRADEIASEAPFEGVVRAPLVRLACLCLEMRADELYDWLGKLRLRREEQDTVAGAATIAPLLGERLSADDEIASSELREMLDGRPLEVLLTAVVLAPDTERARERVTAYLERIRHVRLEITGEDLKQAGVPESPQLGEALRETLALKLDGALAGRDQELQAALRLLGRIREVKGRAD